MMQNYFKKILTCFVSKRCYVAQISNCAGVTKDLMTNHKGLRLLKKERENYLGSKMQNLPLLFRFLHIVSRKYFRTIQHFY